MQVFHSLHDDKVTRAFPEVPRGEPGFGKTIKANVIDTTRSKRVLGLEYTDFATSIGDTIRSLAERQLTAWSS
jgi:hypothetical protein